MIYYKKTDGSSDRIDDDRCGIKIYVGKNHTFTIERTSYGWDEYDYYIDEITDVCELSFE